MLPLKVLLLEDSPSDAELILRALRRGGYALSYRQADTAEKMREALDTSAWDIILSDYNMPNFNAMNALLLLKQRELDIPFLVISGAIGEETAVELMKCGAEDYVMKSNLARLAPAVARSLREAASRRREKEAREAAELAILEREKMLAIVSHDLKNPLGAIKLNLQLMQRAYGQASQTDRDKKLLLQIGRIERSTDRMASLINDILDYAKIDAGRYRVEKALHSADELVAEVLDIFQPQALQKSIFLESRLPEANCQGLFDRERIFQVLSNLVGNAIKFTPPGGRVSIEALFGSDGLVFGVKDSGPGIDKDHLPHIFKRFWQATRTERLGTGLGLSIAQGIVEAHGGRIWAESVPGSGSSFYFSIPGQKAPVRDTEKSSRPRLSFRKILLIDDDVDLREVFAKALTGEGFEVHSSEDGESGFELLQALDPSPDLVIVDYNLPKITGAEFIQKKMELNSTLASIPVLLTSADPTAADNLGPDSGTTHFLRKPSSLDTFLRTVESCLAARLPIAEDAIGG